MPFRVVSFDPVVGLEEMARHADAQALHALAETGGEIGCRTIGAGGIVRVVPGHRLQQQRAVLDSPGERAGVVQRVGQRQYAGARAQAVSGLDTGQTAQRRGTADRAAGVRPGAAQHHAGGDRGAGAGGRSGSEIFRVPRVARRRPGQVEGRAAHGELVRRQLAQHDRSGLGPKLHDAGILAGDVVLQQLGVRGGTDAGGVVDVLVADRDAVEFAPQRAGHHARFGGLGVGQRAFLGQQQEGVQRVVERLDAGEAGLGELNRRKLLGGDLFGRLGDGRDGGHQRTSGTKIRAGSASRGIGVLTRASMASSRP